MEQVHQEAQFQEVVEWNEGEDDAGELVDDVEGAEADPVGEPLLVVIKPFGLQGQEAHEGWIGNADEVGDIGGADAEHNGEDACGQGVLHKRFDWGTGGLRNLL